MLFQKKYIQQLKPYISGLQKSQIQQEYNLKTITKLNANENPWGCSHKAKKILKNLDFSIYPDSSNRVLTDVLSQHLNIFPENLILGNGSDEILLIIALGYLKENQEVLVSENTFSQYSRVCLTMGAKVRYIPTQNHHYNLEAFSKMLTSKTTAVFLCNPNNPTGTYFTDTQLELFLEKVPSSCFVILDEAYAEFVTATNFPKSIDLLQKYSNLIIIKTFSKAYGLAGIRLGYGISKPNNISYLKKILDFNPFNINIVAQNMAIETLKDTAFITKILKETKKGKQQIEEAFIEYKLNFLPTQANFICFKTFKNSKELAHLMILKGVLIRPIDHFGLKGWCRVTIGSKKQNKHMLLALKQCLKK